MADAAFKIVLLVLLLAWSGYFVVRVSKGIMDGWRVGRFGVYQKGKAIARVVRAAAHPIEFWLTMALWHAMLVVFVGVFSLGVYGIWHVIISR